MVPWHIHDFLMNDTSRRRRFMKCKTVSDDGFKEPFFRVKKEGFESSHSMTAIKYDSWGFSDRREMSWRKFIFNGYRRRIIWPPVKEKWRCISWKRINQSHSLVKTTRHESASDFSVENKLLLFSTESFSFFMKRVFNARNKYFFHKTRDLQIEYNKLLCNE